MILKLEKLTLGAQIADQMRDAILKGEIAPGAAIVETSLAQQFGVSRGPLREAIRQLIDEGLLVQIPFTGTHVVDLTVEAVREIYSLRTALEIFAFELIWQRRDKSFRRELIRRHTSLSRAIEREDEIACISSELALHSLVYEASKHGLLLDAWNRLSGKLQIYWSAHHLAHQRRGPRRDSHESYIEAALGPDLERMRDEIRSHMRLGAVATETFIAERQSTSTAALSSVAPSSTSSTFGTIARRMPKI